TFRLPGWLETPAHTARIRGACLEVKARRRPRRRRGLVRPLRERAEDLFAVFPCDALGNVARQVRKPAPRPVGMLRDVVPALGNVAVGADHEAVGELHEYGAPGGVHLAAGGVIGAEGEVAPEVHMLAQHLGHALRALEAGMRPEDARLRPLLEQALDGVDV